MAIDYGFGFDEMLGEDPEVLRQRQLAMEQAQPQPQPVPTVAIGGQEAQDIGNPPKTVEELAQRQTGWGGFLAKLGSDDMWKRALLAGLQGAMAPTNPRASSSRQLFHRAATGMSGYLLLDAKAQEAAALKKRQAEQDELARQQAEQSIAASRQSVTASQASEIRGTSAEARAAAEERRRVQAAPLDLRQKEAAVRLAEANASPEKLALDTREAEARLEYTKVLQAKAGKEPVEPVNVKLDMLRKSSMGQLRPGETEQTRDIRLYDYLLEQERDANLGARSNMAMQAVKAAADLINRDNPEIQEKGRIAQKWIDAQFPGGSPPPVTPPPAKPLAATEQRTRPPGQEIGKFKTDPVQVASEEEAQRLPKGTWIILNGRVGQVR